MLRTSNLAGIFTGTPSEQKPFKNLGEKGAWAYPGTAQIFGVHPIISGTRKATNFKLDRCIQSIHSNKSPLIIWEKRECGRIQGRRKFFWIPPIISGMRRATNFKFGRYITGSIRAKSPLKYGRKGAPTQNNAKYRLSRRTLCVMLWTEVNWHSWACWYSPYLMLISYA